MDTSPRTENQLTDDPVGVLGKSCAVTAIAKGAYQAVNSASGLVKTGSPYNTKRWRTERLEHLHGEPWCRYCAAHGRRIPANVVDHISPWRGNLELFWDRRNWQSLCKCCHDSIKQRFEKSGVMVGSNAGGFPLSPNRYWN